MRIKTLSIFLFIAATHNLFSQDPVRFRDDVRATYLRYSDMNNFRKVILFTGSSSIRLWKDIVDYFPGKNIVNTGFGGSHMSDLLYYADSLIIIYNPVQVFIYEGDNDLSSGKKSEEIVQDAKILVSDIRKKLPRTQIVFIAAKPSPLRWDLRDEYIRLNKMYKDLSSDYRYIDFADVWTPMIDQSGRPKSEIFTSDSLHINKLGYDIWAGIIRKIIR